MTPSKKHDAKTPTAPATAQPQPAPATAETKATTPTAAPSTPTKQQTTINQLIEGWKAKGVDLSKLTQVQDGKFVNVVVGEGWPIVAVGPTGGVNLPQIRSYAKPFDAAMDAKALLEKQTARDQKKATATAAPAPVVVKVVSTVTPTAQPEQAKAVAPTQKKRQADAEIEARLQA